MLKFEFRNKQFYPLMLLLFAFLRKCVEIILNFHPYKESVNFLKIFLIFFSQSLIGFIINLFYSPKTTQRKSPHTQTSISFRRFYQSNNSRLKKIVLIIFTSFFNFVGSIIRSNDVINLGKKEDNNSQLEIRVRSVQIIISALVCYFTIRLNIYKHQILSLIFILFFLIIIIIIELFISFDILIKILSLLICAMSCLSRAFMDVTEKYLFDYDYINIFKMLIHEGNIGTLLYLIYFLCHKTYQKQGRNLLKDMSEFDWSFISFIFLIILFIIFSGLRNAYRVSTNKYYSPMSRALIESTLDPFVFLYNCLSNNNEKDIKFWAYFGIIIFCLTIISFFSLVYNDFIILYCCGLERNTYREITRRLYLDSNDIIQELKNDTEPQMMIDENGEVYSEDANIKNKK